ncbi:hypothetical protein C2G38_2037286 [Gigaspora rosea]|uniref:Uncharacterized protein n=1 Tax=Gigaspora rosea TaxID=44941 RepID=A0A397V6B8_9GLOM|nr:hypothetical protein C2G38_2037286 [Gigaspora rosea]
MNNAEQKQIVSKKAMYASGFRKMKKALNFALDLGCEEELLNMIAQFINQKKAMLENGNDKGTKRAMLENVNDEGTQAEPEVVMDPLVTKLCGRPSTKRLKSSSETQNYKGTIHNIAINPQDPNLRVPFSNIDLRSIRTMGNNTKELG